jgi:hypothetical protein
MKKYRFYCLAASFALTMGVFAQSEATVDSVSAAKTKKQEKTCERNLFNWLDK